MTYEFDAEKYKRASKHQKEWGNRVISRLDLHGNETILDLGCGDGVLTEQLALLAPDGRVVGIDASRAMIETASKIQRHNLAFVQMDINNLSYIDEFDIIFSNAALQWVKDHKRLLHASWTALKPDGFIRWNFAGAGNSATFIDTVQEVMVRDPYRTHFAGFEMPWFMPTVEEYEPIIKGTGFDQIELELQNADRHFADSAEMIRWLDQPALVPFLGRLPVEHRTGFRDTVVEEMVRRTQQADGRCFEIFRRFDLKAVKSPT